MKIGMYPIFVLLAKKRVLVVGGGRMAALRTRQLLAAGAHVTVVSPRVSRILAGLAQSSSVVICKRRFRPSDVSRDFFMVIGATSHAATQAAIARQARKVGLLHNVVDAPQHCNFFTPAMVDRGDLKIAICSAGQSPVLSGRLRSLLDQTLPQRAGDWTAQLGELRRRLKKAFPGRLDKRKKLINAFIEQAIKLNRPPR